MRNLLVAIRLDISMASTSDEPAAEEPPAEAPAAEAPTQEFVAAGEGTVSDGKGSTKKIFFLQKKDGESKWLKKMSDGLTSMGAAANEAVARAGKMMEKSDEKKETEKMETEDKEKPKTLVESASTRLSDLMASIKPKDDPAKDGEDKSRLSSLRFSLGGAKTPSVEDDVAQLKAQVAELQATVATLVEKVKALEPSADSS